MPSNLTLKKPAKQVFILKQISLMPGIAILTQSLIGKKR